MIKHQDSLEFLKEQKEFSTDIIYSDPPYALGSEIIVREDGKVDYAKAIDFMSKWDMPTGEWWESWFKEAFRTLKHGGHCIMFGMDRQLLLFKYYAHLAGFTEKQSLYWYFISNFPKATDLSKMLMKNLNNKKIETGEVKKHAQKGIAVAEERGVVGGGAFGQEKEERLKEPTHPLAKKYNGYKYSICPLKATNETIMIFQKPYKTGSCLHDTLAMENGDETITCGALDIKGNRVGTGEIKGGAGEIGKKGIYGNLERKKETETINTGRYPSQTYCDTEASKVLGESSKILYKCDYEKNEHDLYIYCPKVSKKERNAGCEDMPLTNANRDNAALTNAENRQASSRNSHPTLKPISLNKKILKLFKTPNEQKILYPFVGAGSEVIGGLQAGFDNWEGCELSEEYIKIAEARIKHWRDKLKQEKLI